MPVPPPPPNPRYRKPVKVAVLLGPDDGSKPAITDRCDYLIPMSAHISVGGQSLDSINLRYDLSRFGGRLQDTTTPSGFQRSIELRVENPATGDLDQLIAWGRLARQPQTIGNVETVDFVARLDHFLFGDRLTGYPIKDPASGDEVLVRQAWTINPVIDSARLPNRSDLTDSHGARFFVDPESLRTAHAQTLQAATASRWDLASLVFRLCWTLNADEDWIANPSLTDLQNVLGIGTSLLENHTIPLGLSLPEALDQLLTPYGFTWFVRHTVDSTTLAATSTIAVIERGHGLAIDLRLQRLGDTIDSSETNVDSVSLSYDIAERPNVVHGLSKLAMREITCYLLPAWPPEFDTLTIADLKEERTDDVSTHTDVFRKFVLDTAGEYSGSRPEFSDDYADLSSVFGVTTVPMRRRFHPALSRAQDDKQLVGRNGYLLEWRPDFLSEWEPYPHSFSVLKSEAGIMLESNVPEDFREQFHKRQRAADIPQPLLRLTACLEGDNLTEYVTPRRAESPNGADIVRVYDLQHKFHDARVHDAGDFKSVLYEAHHEGITAIVTGTSSSVTVAVDLTGQLAIGDRINILDSTGNDGIYHVAAAIVVSGGSTTIPLAETLVNPTADGVLAILTDEEAPLTAMTAYCDGIQENEDFVVIHASATLFGLDHPEYELGKIVPSIQTRNLSLNSLAPSAASQRHPQVVGLTYQFNPEQRIDLRLEQYDKATDRAHTRVLKR